MDRVWYVVHTPKHEVAVVRMTCLEEEEEGEGGGGGLCEIKRTDPFVQI